MNPSTSSYRRSPLASHRRRQNSRAALHGGLLGNQLRRAERTGVLLLCRGLGRRVFLEERIQPRVERCRNSLAKQTRLQHGFIFRVGDKRYFRKHAWHGRAEQNREGRMLHAAIHLAAPRLRTHASHQSSLNIPSELSRIRDSVSGRHRRGNGRFLFFRS